MTVATAPRTHATHLPLHYPVQRPFLPRFATFPRSTTPCLHHTPHTHNTPYTCPCLIDVTPDTPYTHRTRYHTPFSRATLFIYHTTHILYYPVTVQLFDSHTVLHGCSHTHYRFPRYRADDVWLVYLPGYNAVTLPHTHWLLLLHVLRYVVPVWLPHVYLRLFTVLHTRLPFTHRYTTTLRFTVVPSLPRCGWLYGCPTRCRCRLVGYFGCSGYSSRCMRTTHTFGCYLRSGYVYYPVWLVRCCCWLVVTTPHITAVCCTTVYGLIYGSPPCILHTVTTTPHTVVTIYGCSDARSGLWLDVGYTRCLHPTHLRTHFAAFPRCVRLVGWFSAATFTPSRFVPVYTRGYRFGLVTTPHGCLPTDLHIYRHLRFRCTGCGCYVLVHVVADCGLVCLTLVTLPFVGWTVTFTHFTHVVRGLRCLLFG